MTKQGTNSFSSNSLLQPHSNQLSLAMKRAINTSEGRYVSLGDRAFDFSKPNLSKNIGMVKALFFDLLKRNSGWMTNNKSENTKASYHQREPDLRMVKNLYFDLLKRRVTGNVNELEPTHAQKSNSKRNDLKRIGGLSNLWLSRYNANTMGKPVSCKVSNVNNDKQNMQSTGNGSNHPKEKITDITGNKVERLKSLKLLFNIWMNRSRVNSMGRPLSSLAYNSKKDSQRVRWDKVFGKRDGHPIKMKSDPALVSRFQKPSNSEMEKMLYYSLFN